MKPGILLMAMTFALSPLHAVSPGTSGDVTPPWHVPGTPAVVSQEVRFSSTGADLVGTVYLPSVGNHLPAIVVLHHSALGTRDAAVYHHLREGLPPMGFAVLIYDRRGSGQSSGNPQSVDYETLADDAIAGQRALARIPRIDPGKIGFWGLSQGGWLAVLAAGRSPDAAFAISVSAPLVTADEQMQFATSNLLALRGYSRQDIQEMLETRSAWMGYVRGTNSRANAVDALSKAQSKAWFSSSFLPSPSTVSDSAALRRKMNEDPVAAVAKAKVPLLFIFGGADPWVPVAQSVQRLEALREERHNIESWVVADASHEMMFPVSETMQADANAAPQAPEYFMILGTWLSRLFPTR